MNGLKKLPKDYGNYKGGIMEEILTKKKAIELFREHWRNLSKSGSMDKRGGLPTGYIGLAILNLCFLCEYSIRKPIKGMSYCQDCPIEWPGTKDTSFMCESSLYGKWIKAGITRRKQLAKQISELPEKK